VGQPSSAASLLLVEVSTLETKFIGGGGGSRTRVRNCRWHPDYMLSRFLLPALPGNVRRRGSEPARNPSG